MFVMCSSMDGHLEILRDWGVTKAKLSWSFQKGAGEGQTKKPSVGRAWIFYFGTKQYRNYIFTVKNCT